MLLLFLIGIDSNYQNLRFLIPYLNVCLIRSKAVIVPESSEKDRADKFCNDGCQEINNLCIRNNCSETDRYQEKYRKDLTRNSKTGISIADFHCNSLTGRI